MEMTPETIKALLDAFDGSDWREMVVTVGEDRLHVSRDPLPEGATLAPPAAPPRHPAAAVQLLAAGGCLRRWRRRGHRRLRKRQLPEGVVGPLPRQDPRRHPPAGTPIESPSVGLFWRSPSPGAPPFVEVGDKVANGQTVAIVEVMKLMNHVASPVDGVVTAILVDNGAPVEFGQTIVVVDPDG